MSTTVQAGGVMEAVEPPPDYNRNPNEVRCPTCAVSWREHQETCTRHAYRPGAEEGESEFAGIAFRGLEMLRRGMTVDQMKERMPVSGYCVDLHILPAARAAGIDLR